MGFSSTSLSKVTRRPRARVTSGSGSRPPPCPRLLQHPLSTRLQTPAPGPPRSMPTGRSPPNPGRHPACPNRIPRVTVPQHIPPHPSRVRRGGCPGPRRSPQSRPVATLADPGPSPPLPAPSRSLVWRSPSRPPWRPHRCGPAQERPVGLTSWPPAGPSPASGQPGELTRIHLRRGGGGGAGAGGSPDCGIRGCAGGADRQHREQPDGHRHLARLARTDQRSFFRRRLRYPGWW